MVAVTAIQKFFMAILPPAWAASMEKESRSWKVRCACGAETSIWDLGGIRWGAAGQPKRYLMCPKCGQASWQTVSRERLDEKPDGVGGH
jgi:hypothetical protein